MAKAILMSIKPKWVAKILNGEKTIEIRKKFPKDYVGWVYIYCTKGKPYLFPMKEKPFFVVNNNVSKYGNINGKVVARFWCDKVEEIENKPFTRYGYPRTKTLDSYDLAKYICVDNCDIKEYLAGGDGYAIHITKLEIFDKPIEISEFVPYNIKQNHYKPFPTCDFRATRAPQSWCYVEV